MAVKKQPIPFGKYFLLDRINIGGMAEVWRAKTFGEQGFEKLVAIKRILPNIAEDDEFITMFIDEAKITVQLTHANIAQVFDLGKIGDSYFIAMEYVAGRDLRAIFDRCRKRSEPAPIPLVCFAVGKMCEGLDYAHRKKDTAGRDLHIVHRDVSPQNCLVSFEGEVKVIDFGIAKAANKATKTQAGILKGKFGYMSPEQVRGLPLDQRSDVFACGVVLYEMLTGERLFVGDSDFSVLEKVRQVDILPPTKYNRRIPEGLEKIVMKALAKDPEERYQWASDLADALQRFLITSDSVFSRKDLMQYMKSTFAEDVEREKVRQAEYAEIKLPPGLAALAAAHGGAPVGATNPSYAPPAPSAPPIAAAIPRQMTPPPPPVVAPRAPPPAPRPPPPVPAAAAPGRDSTLPGVPAHASLDAPTLFGGPPPGPPVAHAGELGDELFGDEKTQSPTSRPAAPAGPPRPPPAAPLPVAARPPPHLGDPARPQRTHTLPPQQPPVPSTYKPRMAEPSHVTSGSRPRWILPAIAGIVTLVVVGAGAIYMLGREGGVLCAYEPKDAKLFVDGVEACAGSPCVANKIASGTHRVEIRKEHFESFERDVDVPRGDFYRIVPDIKLKAIISMVPTVVATDPADAEVKVDGKVVKELGRPGIFSGELKAGEPHEVVVSKPGFQPWRKVLTPGANDKQINEFAGPLKRAALQVKFTSVPAGAKVLVDGQAVGNTPFETDALDPGATHAIVFQKNCFEDATHTILPGGGEQQVVEKKLAKKSSCP